MIKRERRTYTAEFKNQIVQLYLNDRLRQDIIREYDLTSSTFDNGVKQNICFFQSDNRANEVEMIMLCK